jgi:hypothetical protein
MGMYFSKYLPKAATEYTSDVQAKTRLQSFQKQSLSIWIVFFGPYVRAIVGMWLVST